MEGVGERAEIRAALTAFMKGRSVPDRRILKLMMEGKDEESITEKTGCALKKIAAVRADLAAFLSAQASTMKGTMKT